LARAEALKPRDDQRALVVIADAADRGRGGNEPGIPTRFAQERDIEHGGGAGDVVEGGVGEWAEVAVVAEATVQQTGFNSGETAEEFVFEKGSDGAAIDADRVLGLWDDPAIEVGRECEGSLDTEVELGGEGGQSKDHHGRMGQLGARGCFFSGARFVELHLHEDLTDDASLGLVVDVGKKSLFALNLELAGEVGGFKDDRGILDETPSLLDFEAGLFLEPQLTFEEANHLANGGEIEDHGDAIAEAIFAFELEAIVCWRDGWDLVLGSFLLGAEVTTDDFGLDDVVASEGFHLV